MSNRQSYASTSMGRLEPTEQQQQQPSLDRLRASGMFTSSPAESRGSNRTVGWAEQTDTEAFELAETRVNSPIPFSQQPKPDEEKADVELHHPAHEGHHDVHHDPYDPNRRKAGLRERLKHFTWAWYTLTMSTGGLSLLIWSQPYQFTGLWTIGFVVYIINIVLVFLVTATMIARFLLHRGTLKASLAHEREGLFFPTFWLTVATLITSTERYMVEEGDTQFIWAMQLAFWLYVFCTLLVAVCQFSYLFACKEYGLHTMMPTWILPIFPIMLSGTIASVIAEAQPDDKAIVIVIAGTACQGLGISVSFMMYAHMVGRLMSAGLPNREHRPGLFMCVGPPAFTALAVIGMANGFPDDWDIQHDGIADAYLIRTLALVFAIFLWALALWWFGVALVAVLCSPPKHFHLGFWAMVFPNTGFILATITIGKELDNAGFLWFTTALSILLVCMYLFVFGALIRAVWKQNIMYPGLDEDVNDH